MVAPGRPPSTDEPTETVAVRLPRSIISRIDALAEHNGRSRANYLALIIRRSVEGDPTMDLAAFSQQQRAITEAVSVYANDSALRAWVDHKADTLYFDVSLGGKRRRIAFYDVAINEMGTLESSQLADSIEKLFAQAASWPNGLAEVRCVDDRIVMNNDFPSRTVICVFVGDVPASESALVITSP